MHLLRQWASHGQSAALEFVSLAGNPLGDAVQDALAAALLANRQLVTVDLSACQLGSACGRRLLSLAQSLRLSRASASRSHCLKVRLRAGVVAPHDCDGSGGRTDWHAPCIYGKLS